MSRTLAPAAPRPRRRDALATATTAVVLGLLALFLAWPVLRLLRPGVTGLLDPASRAGLADLLLATLAVALGSAAVTVALGAVLAWTVTRTALPARSVLSRLILLPMLAPPFLPALALVLLAGRHGVLARWLGLGGTIEGFAGIVVAQVVTFLPYVYLLLARALSRIELPLEEVAESLGAGPLTVLRRVTLPQAWPRLVAAGLLVGVLSMADLGLQLVVGGDYRVLATAIWARAIEGGGPAAGAPPALLLLAPCVAAYLLGRYGLGADWLVTVSWSARRRWRPTPPAVGGPLGALFAGAALAGVAVVTLVPLGSLVSVEAGAGTLSLAHYRALAALGGAGQVGASLALGVLAGVVGTLLAVVIGYLAQRRRSVATRVVQAVGLAPVAVPGPALGVGYLLAFGEPPLELTGTLAILVASVVFWKLPVAVQATIAEFARTDPRTEDAAVSLGAGRWRALGRAVLPPLGPVALAIFVAFFVDGLGTVSAVILLVSPELALAGPAIVVAAGQGAVGPACALATVLLALGAGAALARRLLTGPRRAVVLFP